MKQTANQLLRKSVLPSVCFSMLLVVSFVVHAQGDIIYDQQGSFRNMIYENANRDMARHDAEMRKSGAGKKSGSTVVQKTSPGTPAGSSLTFTASAPIRSEVTKKVALDMGHGKEKQAHDIENLLIKTDAVGNFNNSIKKFGLDPNSLPDMLAGFVAIFWEVVNGKNAGSFAKGILLYRDELKASMLSNAKILAWDNDKRQRVCESMALYASMAQGAAKTKMTAATLQNIRETAINVTGIDISKFQFTSDGFRKK